jgi:hypothetical protein
LPGGFFCTSFELEEDAPTFSGKPLAVKNLQFSLGGPHNTEIINGIITNEIITNEIITNKITNEITNKIINARVEKKVLPFYRSKPVFFFECVFQYIHHHRVSDCIFFCVKLLQLTHHNLFACCFFQWHEGNVTIELISKLASVLTYQRILRLFHSLVISELVES